MIFSRKKRYDREELVLAKKCSYSMDCRRTRLNNNVMIIGSSGCGKTRCIVSPNIDHAYGSYVVLDPKGNLYEQHRYSLRRKGYVVKKLDFIHPKNSIGYNPFSYIRTAKDVKTIAHTFIYGNEQGRYTDPYWPESGEQLLTILLGYIWENCPENEKNIGTLLELLANMDIREDEFEEEYKNVVDLLFEDLEKEKGNNWLVTGYKLFKNNSGRTKKCIVNQVNSSVNKFNIPQVVDMLSEDEVYMSDIGTQKTALFVVVSDNDRSMDPLSGILFTQLIHELCTLADDFCAGELPVPVRFIMDDFATNLKINDFPKMISSFRSRNISCMLILQAEAQLRSLYGYDAETVITNCDTYVYLGGSDIQTAENVGIRAGKSLRQILYMPIGRVWVFRRGSKPVYTRLNEPYQRNLDELLVLQEDEITLDEPCGKTSAKDFSWMQEDETTLDEPCGSASVRKLSWLPDDKITIDDSREKVSAGDFSGLLESGTTIDDSCEESELENYQD